MQMTAQKSLHDVRDFRIYDEERELRFNGKFLGFSSSEGRGSDRWIEFSIYKTSGAGKYILSRVGRSVRFHDKVCDTVASNPHLKPAPLASLSLDTSACPVCLPRGDDGLPDNYQVYPEQDRPWAGVFSTPRELIDFMSNPQSRGENSLTRVARAVLESAAENDKDLHDAYYYVEVE